MSTDVHRCKHNIPITPFVVHNTSDQRQFIELNICYIISLDLHKRYSKCEWFSKYLHNNNKYLTVDYLNVYIHDGIYRSITYVVEFGEKYRLPSFLYNK